MLYFEIFKWATAIASLIGVVLNIRHDRRCFYIWTVTNAAWSGIDVWHGVWAQAVLQATYCGLAVWGIYSWSKKDQ